MQYKVCAFPQLMLDGVGMGGGLTPLQSEPALTYSLKDEKNPA